MISIKISRYESVHSPPLLLIPLHKRVTQSLATAQNIKNNKKSDRDLKFRVNFLKWGLNLR